MLDARAALLVGYDTAACREFNTRVLEAEVCGVRLSAGRKKHCVSRFLFCLAAHGKAHAAALNLFDLRALDNLDAALNEGLLD